MRPQRHLLPAALAGAVAVLACGVALSQPRPPPVKWKDPNGPPTATEVWLERLVGRYRFDGVIEVVMEDPDYVERRCAPLPPDPNLTENPPPPPEPLCQGVEGLGDCVAIGASPGVQCIFSAHWPDMYDIIHPDPESLERKTGVFEVPGGVSNLDPSMALFGLDPNGTGLRYLLVDSKGLAEGAPGEQGGNRATFTTPCVNASTLLSKMFLEEIDDKPLGSCQRVMRIDAKPDGSVVNLSVDFEINEEPFTRYEFQLWRVADPQVSSTTDSR